MKSVLLAGLALAISTAGASAADAGSAAGFVWTGGYIGLQAGYAGGDSRYSNEWGEFANHDPDGLFGGVYAGYNHQLSNNIVLGVEADISAGSIDSSVDHYWSEGNIATGHVANAKLKRSAALRARFGYAADRFMPYLAAGVSFGKYEFNLDHNGAGTMDFKDERSLTGWNIGAGLDFAVTQNVLVRAEYRYTDFGTKDFQHDWGGNSKIDLATHDVRLGVAYKF